MTNLFKKIATSIIGMAMAIGVGIGLSTNSVREVKAGSATISFTNVGSGLSSTSGDGTTDVTATGTTTSYTFSYGGAKKQGESALLAKGTSGGTSFFSNKTAMPGDIKSLTLHINSGASGSTTYHCAFKTTECTSRYITGSTAVNITGGNSNKYTCSVSGARYFCIALGNNNNGQVLGFDVEYEGESQGGGGDTPAPTYTDTYSLNGNTYAIKANDLYLGLNGTSPVTKDLNSDDEATLFTLNLVGDDTFKFVYDSNKYLANTSSTTVQVSTTSDSWKVTKENGFYRLMSTKVTNTGRYLGVLTASSVWRAYTSLSQSGVTFDISLVTISTTPAIKSIAISGTPASEMGCGAEFNLTGDVTTKFDPSSTLSKNVNWSVSPANAVTFSKNPSASGEQITVTAGNSAAQNVVVTATSAADNTKSASTSSFTIIKSYEITRVDLATSNGQTSFDANGASSVVVNLTTAIVYSGDAGEGALTLTSNPATHATLSAINNGAFTATFDHVGTYTIKSEAVENTSKYATVTLTITGIPYANSSGLTAGNYYIKANTNNYLTGVSGGEGTTSTSPAGALLFTFTLVDDNAWTIVNDGKYLNISGSNSKNLELSATSKTLSISSGSESGGYIIGNGTRALAWYSTDSTIRTYATSNATDMTLELDDGKTSVPLAVAQSSVSMEVGDNDFAPTVTRTDNDSAVTDYVLTSSNTDAVTIVDNKVHALASGSSTITVSKEATASEKYVSVTFTVSVTHTSSIEDVVKNCADLGRNETAEGTYTIQGTITGVYGNSYVIQQGNYGMLIYNHAVAGATTGKVLRVEGTFGKYNGRIESRTINSAELVDTTPETIHPLLVTNPSSLTNENQNRLMTFTGLTYDSANSATYSSSSDVSIYFKIDDTHSVTYRTNRYVSADAHTALAAKMNQVIAAAANEETEGATFNLVNVHYCIYTDSNNVSSQQFNIDDADKIQIIPNSLTKEEKVQKFVDDYMHFDDIEDNETTRNSSGTACSGVNGYYRKAKSALLALGEECVSLFQSDDTFNAAQERYESWAVINQDLSPYTEDTQSTNTIYGTQNSNNVSIIIVVVSMLSITALGGFFFLRKRKEEK